ncbi:MAG: nucleotidyl transferase AbiEii/AbiGii toxin family protein [Candidatus Margulisbacteria bacterium]|nr:nucleotidyl transferase AbiEii/AbiGii toxin family protein [Candidatus Margulisiibacteriota bacterium]
MVERDYEELLKLFNKNKVKYCIVGAFALAFYSIPRYTKDIDLLVEPSPANAKKILKALNEFGFGSLKLKVEDFSLTGKVIQLGYEPLRIDLLTSIDGCSFDKVWKHRKKGTYGKVRVNFIGISELKKNKKATGRPQDIIDLKKIK